MRVLLDTNVVLDVLFRREPFVKSASEIWQAHEQGRLTGYISAITPANVFYIARKITGNETARNIINDLLTTFQICPLDGNTLKMAAELQIKDYEDAIQVATAQLAQLDGIITRDSTDFANAGIVVYSPADFLTRLNS